MTRDEVRLRHILDALKEIESLTGRGRENFDRDMTTKAAILHWLTVIGEASRSLSEDLRSSQSGVPWRRILSLRNFIVHEYFALRFDLIWNIASQEMEPLTFAVGEMIRQIESASTRPKS